MVHTRSKKKWRDLSYKETVKLYNKFSRGKSKKYKIGLIKGLMVGTVNTPKAEKYIQDKLDKLR